MYLLKNTISALELHKENVEVAPRKEQRNTTILQYVHYMYMRNIYSFIIIIGWDEVVECTIHPANKNMQKTACINSKKINQMHTTLLLFCIC